ncbi:unnamed protein product [Schistosoma curassoni]|uniref:LRRcap domain-containing protein n=1 Tax=Schistosoma curassoni TaxID=6186 RepID=A0A183KCH9_9TREM|nr:unnamed protein product [Schistosoma curassoni]
MLTGNIPTLHDLHLNNNPNLNSLPAELSLCGKLIILNLESCPLRALPEPIVQGGSAMIIYVECIKELFNRPAPLDPLDIEAAPTDIPIDVTSPSSDEEIMTIRDIKSGKAAGPDNISAEALASDRINCKDTPSSI